MTGKQALAAVAAITDLAKWIRAPRTSFVLARCLSRLRPEVDALREAAKPTPELAEYDMERLSTAAAYAIRDTDGSPCQAQGQYVIADHGRFHAAVTELREKFSDALAAQAQRTLELDALLDEPLNVTLPQIAREDFEREGALDAACPNLALLLEPLLGHVIID